MKTSIYSNRNDEMYKQLTSRNFDFKNNQKEIESTITKISNIFIKENNQLVENAERKRKINS